MRVSSSLFITVFILKVHRELFPADVLHLHTEGLDILTDDERLAEVGEDAYSSARVKIRKEGKERNGGEAY